jgi:D-3-phosphoglycerate dehydrogenase
MEVVITDKRFYTKELKEKFAGTGHILALKPYKTESELLNDIIKADGVITTSARFSESVIQGLHNCKVIVRCGIGVDNIDLVAATQKGIYIANTPGFYVEDVSTHTVGLLLALSRKLALADRLIRTGEYDFSLIQPVQELRGKILGMIGLGAVGRAIVEKTRPFGLSYLVYDPYLDGRPSMSGLEIVKFEYLIENSDFISVHCPLNSETKGLLGEKEFRKMKPSTFVINTARGGIINEPALIKAIQAGWISGAGLDVLSEEPPRSDHPLLRFHNVILTPHIAWYSEEAVRKMGLAASEEVLRVFQGDFPICLVNKDITPQKRGLLFSTT